MWKLSTFNGILAMGDSMFPKIGNYSLLLKYNYSPKEERCICEMYLTMPFFAQVGKLFEYYFGFMIIFWTYELCICDNFLCILGFIHV